MREHENMRRAAVSVRAAAVSSVSAVSSVHIYSNVDSGAGPGLQPPECDR